MTTTINKTNGAVLTTIADGAVDLSATNIALIGRLYRNYGELVNENLVKLLENFANATSPSAPIVGQLWFDTVERRLKVFRSTGFVPLAMTSSSSAEPGAPAVADFWYDTDDAQLKFYTGTTWQPIAPTYNTSQGITGAFAETITDTLSGSHVIVKVYQGGTVIATFSADPEYTPAAAIGGFTTIKQGITLNNGAGYRFAGTATNADMLDNLDSTAFMRTDGTTTTTGSLISTNAQPLVLGPAGEIVMNVGATETDIVKTDAGSLRFFTDNIRLVMTLNSDQQVLLQDGSNTVPSLTFTSDPDSGIYRVNANEIGIAAGGAQRLRVTTAGAVVTGTLTATDLAATAGVTAVTGTITTLGTTTLTAPTISGNTTFTGNVIINGATQLGNAGGDLITFTAGTLSLPNGLLIDTGSIEMVGSLEAGALTAVGDIVVGDDAFVDSELLVGYNIGTGVSRFRVIDDGTVTIGTNGTTVRSNFSGDLTLMTTAHVAAANTAKWWAVWTDDAPGTGFVFLGDHDVVSITRNQGGQTGVYRINLDYAMTGGQYWSIVGMSNFGTMQMRSFPVGGSYVEVFNQTLDTYLGTNNSTYNSVVAFGL